MSMELCSRKDVPVEQTWDLSLIFAEEKLMWEELERTKAKVKAFAETYAGHLDTSEQIVRCLKAMEPILKSISRIWSYSGLAVETDYTDNALRERDEKVSDEITHMYKDMAFVDSEILLAPEKELEAAVAIADRILREGDKAVAGYKRFLSAGSGVPPIEALKYAGVDMNDPATVASALQVFTDTVNRLEKVLGE